MKHFCLIILGIVTLCLGCAGTPQTSSTELAPQTSPVVAENTAQIKRTLPPLAQGDMRIEVYAQGPVIDAHRAGDQVTITRVDLDTPQHMFQAKGEWMGMPEGAGDFIQTADINFDGYMDILVPHAVGAHNAYYRAWIWDLKTQQYLEIPAFKDLGSHTLHPENKEIHVFTHISAAEYTESVWKFQGNDFIQTLLIAVAPQANQPDQFKIEITKTQNGQKNTQTQIVSENELTQAVQKAYQSP